MICHICLKDTKEGKICKSCRGDELKDISTGDIQKVIEKIQSRGWYKFPPQNVQEH